MPGRLIWKCWSPAARDWEQRSGRPVQVSIDDRGAVWPVSGDAVRLLETFTALVNDAAHTLPADAPIAVAVANRPAPLESRQYSPGSARVGAQAVGRCVAVSITGGTQWLTSPEQIHALQNDLPVVHTLIGGDLMLAQVQGVVRQHRGAITVDAGRDACRVTISAAGDKREWDCRFGKRCPIREEGAMAIVIVVDDELLVRELYSVWLEDA
ncbi:MAG: hypothetical protein R2844_09205 [Caldilineales bacterium]